MYCITSAKGIVHLHKLNIIHKHIITDPTPYSIPHPKNGEPASNPTATVEFNMFSMLYIIWFLK